MTNATADELMGLVLALSRTAIRATRAAEGLPALPESWVAVLRTLSARGAMPPAQLAAALDLARPTVSNLVRDLTAAGLLERRRSDADGRSVLLAPTPRAEAILASFRRGRSALVARAFAGLSTDDRDRLVAALPALRHLLEELRSGK